MSECRQSEKRKMGWASGARWRAQTAIVSVFNAKKARKKNSQNNHDYLVLVSVYKKKSIIQSFYVDRDPF